MTVVRDALYVQFATNLNLLDSTPDGFVVTVGCIFFDVSPLFLTNVHYFTPDFGRFTTFFSLINP